MSGVVVCPLCGGVSVADRGPLDAPHCRDCGFQFDHGDTLYYDQNYSFVFPYRLGRFKSRPNPFPSDAKEAT